VPGSWSARMRTASSPASWLSPTCNG
jgi:hypothetical protein